MDKTQTIKASAQTLGLTHTKISLDEILHTAQENDYSYLDLIGYVFDCEITYRQDKAREKRIKEAGFPYPKYLKDFDLSFCKAISKKQFKQLSTCVDRRDIQLDTVRTSGSWENTSGYRSWISGLRRRL